MAARAGCRSGRAAAMRASSAAGVAGEDAARRSASPPDPAAPGADGSAGDGWAGEPDREDGSRCDDGDDGSEVMSTWYGECVRPVGVAGHRRPLFGFAAVECWEDCSEVGFKYVGREGRGDRLL